MLYPLLNSLSLFKAIFCGKSNCFDRKVDFVRFEVIFLNVWFFSPEGGSYSRSYFQIRVFIEKMSSVAGLIKKIILSRNKLISGLFSSPRSSSIVNFLNVQAKFWKLQKNVSEEVVTNIVLKFDLCIFSGLPGGGSNFARRQFPKTANLGSYNLAGRRFVASYDCFIVSLLLHIDMFSKTSSVVDFWWLFVDYWGKNCDIFTVSPNWANIIRSFSRDLSPSKYNLCKAIPSFFYCVVHSEIFSNWSQFEEVELNFQRTSS